jgi:hypothetical protein
MTEFVLIGTIGFIVTKPLNKIEIEIALKIVARFQKIILQSKQTLAEKGRKKFVKCNGGKIIYFSYKMESLYTLEKFSTISDALFRKILGEFPLKMNKFLNIQKLKIDLFSNSSLFKQ